MEEQRALETMDLREHIAALEAALEGHGDLARQERDCWQRVGSLIDNLPGMVYCSRDDPAMTMELVAGDCQTLTGYSAAEFRADPTLWSDIVHPDDRAHVWEKLHAHRRDKTPFKAEYRIITKDNRVRWLRDKGTPVLDERGEIVQITGFTEDISEKKAAEAEREALQAQLIKAQRMEVSCQLIGGIAHDFNNLLTVVNGFADLLKLQLPPDDPAQGYADKIINAGQKAARLVRQLMAYGGRVKSNDNVTEGRWFTQMIMSPEPSSPFIRAMQIFSGAVRGDAMLALSHDGAKQLE